MSDAPDSPLHSPGAPVPSSPRAQDSLAISCNAPSFCPLSQIISKSTWSPIALLTCRMVPNSSMDHNHIIPLIPRLSHTKLVDNLHSSASSRIALPINEILLDPTKLIWQTPLSVPPACKQANKRYCVPAKDMEFPGSPGFKRCTSCRDAIPVSDGQSVCTVPGRNSCASKVYSL